MNEQIPIHFLRGKRIYVRLDDIVAYFRQLAATEETDARNRILEAVNNLLELGQPASEGD